MEYEFLQIDKQGNIEVLSIFENEAFKHWLNIEIAGDILVVQQWISKLANLLDCQNAEDKWIGKEYTLILESGVIRVRANFLYHAQLEEELKHLKDEGLVLDVTESEGEASIFDFYDLLLHYRDFILEVQK